MRKTSLLSSRSTRRRAVKLADMGVRAAPGFQARAGVRIDLLFTMSDNTRPSCGFDRRATDAEFKCSGRATTPTGGARRDRTDDLLLAKQALSQLSYGPFRDQ